VRCQCGKRLLSIRTRSLFEEERSYLTELVILTTFPSTNIYFIAEDDHFLDARSVEH
jgi:hypothetical protein